VSLLTAPMAKVIARAFRGGGQVLNRRCFPARGVDPHNVSSSAPNQYRGGIFA
jgi:hypothetical protein